MNLSSVARGGLAGLTVIVLCLAPATSSAANHTPDVCHTSNVRGQAERRPQVVRAALKAVRSAGWARNPRNRPVAVSQALTACTCAATLNEDSRQLKSGSLKFQPGPGAYGVESAFHNAALQAWTRAEVVASRSGTSCGALDPRLQVPDATIGSLRDRAPVSVRPELQELIVDRYGNPAPEMSVARLQTLSPTAGAPLQVTVDPSVVYGISQWTAPPLSSPPAILRPTGGKADDVVEVAAPLDKIYVWYPTGAADRIFTKQSTSTMTGDAVAARFSVAVSAADSTGAAAVWTISVDVNGASYTASTPSLSFANLLGHTGLDLQTGAGATLGVGVVLLPDTASAPPALSVVLTPKAGAKSVLGQLDRAVLSVTRAGSVAMKDDTVDMASSFASGTKHTCAPDPILNRAAQSSPAWALGTIWRCDVDPKSTHLVVGVERHGGSLAYSDRDGERGVVELLHTKLSAAELRGTVEGRPATAYAMDTTALMSGRLRFVPRLEAGRYTLKLHTETTGGGGPARAIDATVGALLVAPEPPDLGPVQIQVGLLTRDIARSIVLSGTVAPVWFPEHYKRFLVGQRGFGGVYVPVPIAGVRLGTEPNDVLGFALGVGENIVPGLTLVAGLEFGTRDVTDTWRVDRSWFVGVTFSPAIFDKMVRAARTRADAKN